MELKVIEIGVSIYCFDKHYSHIRVVCDMAVISYINNMDAIKSDSCNNIAYNILDICITEKLWISAVHPQVSLAV